MPFPTWLRALFPAPAPTGGQPKAAPPQPSPDAMDTPEPDLMRADLMPPDLMQPDNGVRMHIAAHDPEFPAKREAAVTTITAAIDAVAQAHGFTKKPKSWAKSGALGTVSIHLQRSRYGFDCHINLGFQPLDDLADGPSGHSPWDQDDFVSLARFYPPHQTDAATAQEPGTIAYLDVQDDPGSLDGPMAVLSEHALPWLVAHLTDPKAPNKPFLSGPVSL